MTLVADDPLTARAELLRRLPVLHDRLRRAGTVGELLAEGAMMARAECGFERALVVGVREHRLTADATDVLADPASDLLRRTVNADPPALRPGTVEADLVRRPSAPSKPDRPSVLAEVLGLEHPSFGVLAPESTTVGILVLDRPHAEVSETDHAIVALFGAMLSVVLEQVTLRARIKELSAELRYLTVSAQALAAEAFTGPITLPVHGRHLPAFQRIDGPSPDTQAASLLTDREHEIAVLLAQGRSNKEIAEQLFLSIETVKDNAGRIARKLGASNRVEAAVRFLGLGPDAPPGGGR